MSEDTNTPKNETLVSAYNHELILDLSCYPDLKKILSRMNNAAIKFEEEFGRDDNQTAVEKKEFAVYIPDTIEKLLTFAKSDPKYYQYFYNLMTKWTKEEIDVEFLQEILLKKKFEKVSVKLITDDIIKNSKSYNLAYEKFIDTNLITHFSPPLNLIGDVIGKILGMSEIHNSMILMRNSHLINEVKKQIPVFLDYTSEFRTMKVEFFQHNIPGLSALSGVSWIIGGIIEGVGLKKHNKIINLAGLIFIALDP